MNKNSTEPKLYQYLHVYPCLNIYSSSIFYSVMSLVWFSKILLTGCQNIRLLKIVSIFTCLIKNSLHFSYGTQKLFIQGREFNLMQQNKPPTDKVKRHPCKIEMTERFKAHEGINYEYPNSKELWLYKVCSFIRCPLVFATAKVI